MLDAQLETFLSLKGKENLYKELKHFCKMWFESTYNETLTKELLSNKEFKHEFAKFLVNQALSDEWCFIPRRINDARLESFINYYVWVAVLNNDLRQDQLNNFMPKTAHIERGSYLKGDIIADDNYALTPVRMMGGSGLYPGYRLFVVNTLCFVSDKFTLGIRSDSGPVRYQQYYKGCMPLDIIRKDKQDREWSLLQVDVSLSDDFTAIFSNALDGDGTVEICDYINDNDIRIIFRANY